jgi:phospholipid/cholesterol/gamma-HCH transport system substrate-binding protein
MTKKKFNGLKLGVFVVAGMAFLVLLLYVIGKNQNLFGSTYPLKVRFENVRGLMKGNNIRYAGINAGTVSDVSVLNDTTVEVTLLVKTKMKNYIHENANVFITTDGLMGNKLVNIEPGKEKSPIAVEGFIFHGSEGLDTDEMLKVLNSTNNDIATITNELKQTVQRINGSKAIWSILNDETLPANLRLSLMRVRSVTETMNKTMNDLHAIISDVEDGKGTVGKLLKDSTLSISMVDAINQIESAAAGADSLFSHVTMLVDSLHEQISNGKGIATAILRDSILKNKLDRTILQIEADARSLDQIMNAVKQSFLFRGYFNRQKRDKNKKNGSSF